MAGIESSFPVSYFKNYYTFGIGPAVELDYQLIHKLSITFSASYLKYYINTNNLDITGSEDFLPMEFGLKLYTLKNIYFSAGTGINLDFGNVITPYKIFSIGIGKELLKKLDISLKYERTGKFDFTPNVFKVKAAYIF